MGDLCPGRSIHCGENSSIGSRIGDEGPSQLADLAREASNESSEGTQTNYFRRLRSWRHPRGRVSPRQGSSKASLGPRRTQGSRAKVIRTAAEPARLWLAILLPRRIHRAACWRLHGDTFHGGAATPIGEWIRPRSAERELRTTALCFTRDWVPSCFDDDSGLS